MQENAIVKQAIPKLVLFDVNGTLLDTAKVKKEVNNILSSKQGFEIWFGLLLQYSLVDNVTGQYHRFSMIAESALQMAADKLQTTIDDGDKKKVLELFTQMPPYKDVKKGLKLLQKAGYKLATLTNSPNNIQFQQLQKGDLAKYFDAMLSIDYLKKYKPSLDAYKWAAETLHLSLSEIIMVAAHGWDITGAGYAGMQTAFIARQGQEIYPLAPKPTFIGKNLEEVANAIIAAYNK